MHQKVIGGLHSGPRWGTLQLCPRSPSWLGSGTPFCIPLPSASAPRTLDNAGTLAPAFSIWELVMSVLMFSLDWFSRVWLQMSIWWPLNPTHTIRTGLSKLCRETPTTTTVAICRQVAPTSYIRTISLLPVAFRHVQPVMTSDLRMSAVFAKWHFEAPGNCANISKSTGRETHSYATFATVGSRALVSCCGTCRASIRPAIDRLHAGREKFTYCSQFRALCAVAGLRRNITWQCTLSSVLLSWRLRWLLVVIRTREQGSRPLQMTRYKATRW